MKKIPLIKSVMTPFPYAIEIDANLEDAMQQMQDHEVRHLPVTDSGELVGIVADRELRLFLTPNGELTNKTLKVRHVYIPDPYVVDINEALDNVVYNMASRHIGSTLVTRKDKLVGIFSATDACRCFAQYLQDQFRPHNGNNAA